MAVSNERAHLTIFWKVENLRCCLQMGSSPLITSNIWNASWKLRFRKTNPYRCILSIERNTEETMNVKVKFSLLSSDGSVIGTGWRRDLVHQDWQCIAFNELIELSLLKDNLHVRFDIWEINFIPYQPRIVFARSHFVEECVSSEWAVRDFSTLQTNKTIAIEIEEEFDRSKYLRFKASIDEEDCFSVAIKAISQTLILRLSKLKVSVIDVNNETIESSEDGRVANMDKELTVNFPSLKQKLMQNSDHCLPGDVLTLRCEVLVNGLIRHKPLEYLDEPVPKLKDSSPSQNQSKLSLLEIDEKIPETVKINTSCSSLIHDLQRMYKEKLFCDFTIETPSKSFAVHRALLIARSLVFRTMLTGDMKESYVNSMLEPGVDEGTMHRFLLFLYTDEVDADVSCENVSRLYSVAHNYLVLSLKQRCSGLLKSGLSVENVCDVLILANSHAEDKDLNLAVIEYIVKHYEAVVSSKEWETFESANVRLANKIMKEVTLKIVKK